MKKIVIMVTASMAFGAWADTETVGGYTWTYRINGDTAEIYKGFNTAAISPLPTGSIAIPSVLGGKPVTSIGSHAFSFCEELTAVTIPEGVMTIDERAFEFCRELTHVTIPESVVNVGDAFYGCGSVYDTATIPNVASVDGWVFGVAEDGQYEPAHYSSFEGSLDLTGCRGIAEGAFRDCKGLTGVLLPSGVKSILRFAFLHCDRLTSVTIPDSVKYIGEGAFCGCSALKSLIVTERNPYYKSDSGLVLTKDGKKLVAAMDGLTDVVIPDGVTDIENYAFCEGKLRNISIPDSVVRIGHEAFDECSNLSTVLIPNGVTRIEDYAFCNCRLTSVTIPSNVKFIGEQALACDTIATVTLPKWCKNAAVYETGDDDEGIVISDKAINLRDHPSWRRINFTDYIFGLSYSGDEGASRKRNIKVTYKDVGGGSSGGGEVAEMWKKAQTFDGAVFRDCNAVGVIQMKVGKASKNGEVAVSGTITRLDGKKLTAKGGKVAVDGESATATLAVKDGTTATVAIGKDGLSGSWNGAEIKAVDVGGNWTKGTATVTLVATSATIPAGTLEYLLPNEEQATVKNGKWTFAKAASVKWAKPKKGEPLPEIYDAESGKGLIVDDTKGKTNFSGLKLTYTPKKGTFKGSFKVYALEGSGKATKLKKYTVNVTGVVVDGVGYGLATCKKPAVSWSVTVE